MRKTVSTATAGALVAAMSVLVGVNSARADHGCGSRADAGRYNAGYGSAYYSGGYVQTQSYPPAPVYYQRPSYSPYSYTYSTPPSYHHARFQPQRYVDMSNHNPRRSHDGHRRSGHHRRQHDRD